MSRNGSGPYSLPAGNPVTTGTQITATWCNTTLSDIASEITGSVAADGQTTITGPIKFSAGSVSAPAMTFSSETNTGFYRSGAGVVSMSIAGSQKYIFGASSVTLGGSASITGTEFGYLTGVTSAIQTQLDAKQPLDSTLTALAGTLTAANKIPYATALNTAGELDLSTSTSLGTSDTTLSSQKAVKTYVDTAVAGVPTLTSGTAQASTSGTAIDFTSIPSGTKRITVMFVGLSTNGTSVPIIQLGDSGGFETTGYLGTASAVAVSATASTAFTTGFGIVSAQAAASVLHGTAILTLVNSATNTWTGIISIGRTDSTANYFFGGSKSLSATLTQIRITTVNGTDAFDAGEINILYE